MGRKKVDSDTLDKEQITFKCPPELKVALEDLARLSRGSVSSLIVEVATLLIKVNEKRIAEYRKAAAVPISMPLFAPSEGGGCSDETV